jgi:hypothetical protein
MYRSSHRWASRSVLMDLFDPRWWLTAGGSVAKRAAAVKSDDASQLAAHAQPITVAKSGSLVDTKLDAVETNEIVVADSDPGVRHAERQINTDASLASFSGNQSESWLFAGVRQVATAAKGIGGRSVLPSKSVQTPTKLIAGDPLAPFLQQSSASIGRGSNVAASEAHASGHVIILESAASAQATAHVAGSDLFLAFGMPFGVCGCGYFASPTRILEYAQGGGMLDRDGQLPGTRLTDGPDYVPSVKSTFGASVSDPLLDRNLSMAGKPEAG